MLFTAAIGKEEEVGKSRAIKSRRQPGFQFSGRSVCLSSRGQFRGLESRHKGRLRRGLVGMAGLRMGQVFRGWSYPLYPCRVFFPLLFYPSAPKIGPSTWGENCTAAVPFWGEISDASFFLAFVPLPSQDALSLLWHNGRRRFSLACSQFSSRKTITRRRSQSPEKLCHGHCRREGGRGRR